MNNLFDFINLILEQEFFTKENQQIKFKIYEKSPRKQDQLDRGWVVHLIEAFINNEKVGYIAISYIPKENFKKTFPTILHYLHKIEGRRFYPGSDFPYKDNYIDYFDELPLWSQVKGLAGMFNYNPLNHMSEINIKNLTENELLEYKNNFLKKLNKDFLKQFRSFENFHVDKPLVDYIQVEPKYQRQRIAAALYEKAARWLADKGLKLYASGIQSTEAKKAWEWLKQNKEANIGTEKHDGKLRTFLSYL